MVTTRSTKRATSQIPKIIIFRHYRLINSTAGEESPEMQPFPVEEIPRQEEQLAPIIEFPNEEVLTPAQNLTEEGPNALELEDRQAEVIQPQPPVPVPLPVQVPRRIRKRQKPYPNVRPIPPPPPPLFPPVFFPPPPPPHPLSMPIVVPFPKPYIPPGLLFGLLTGLYHINP